MFGDAWKQNFLDLNASVTGDTPILVRDSNGLERTNFRELADKYFQNETDSRQIIDNLETLSINKKNYKIKFSKIGYIFRHKVDKIVNLRYEGGKIKTSLNHSIIVFDKEGNLLEKRCEDLKKGDNLL